MAPSLTSSLFTMCVCVCVCVCVWVCGCGCGGGGGYVGVGFKDNCAVEREHYKINVLP